MNKLFIVILLFATVLAVPFALIPAEGQVAYFAAWPTDWVDMSVCNPPGGVYDVDSTLSTLTVAGLKAAMDNWAAAGDRWERIKVPAGTNLHSSLYPADNAMLSVPIKAGATKCLVVESTTPNVLNQMVCSHGLPIFSNTRNPGCTNDINNMWKFTADALPLNGNNNIFFPHGSNHVVIRDMEVTIAPGTAPSKKGVAVNILVYMNGDYVAMERSYVHGWNPGDPGQPTGSTSATNANGVCNSWTRTATVNTAGTAVTWVSGKRFGMDVSDGTNSLGYPQATVTINGVNYQVTNHDPTTSDVQFTIGASAGTQTAVTITWTNPRTGAAQGCGDDSRGVSINCNHCWLAYNYFEKTHWFNGESHVISSGFSTGPVKIVHNWIEAGSAGYFSGGGPANTRGGPTSNYEIRGNFFGRDLSYRFFTGGSTQSPHPPFGCGPLDPSELSAATHDTCPFVWGVKNNIEFKVGTQFLIDGNIIDGVWADGQTGYLMLLTPSSDGGGFDPATGLPLDRINDGVISNNWFRNAPQTIELKSRSGGHGNGNGVSNPLQRIAFFGNVFTNIGDKAQWGNPGPDIAQIPAGNQTYIVTVTRTGGVAHAIAQPNRLTNYASGVDQGSYGSAFDFSSVSSVADVVTADLGEGLDPKIGGTITIANTPGWNGTFTITSVMFGSTTTPCTTGINGVAPYNNDPTFATQPQPCIVTSGVNAGTFGDTVIYTDNINHPGTSTLCSSTNTCKTGTSGIQASIDTHWFRVTDISVGDGVYVRNCTLGTNPAAFQVGSSGIVPALAPTNPGGLDVYYSNPGPDDASGTKCLLENGNGYPKGLTFSYSTFLSQRIMSLGIGPGINAQLLNNQYNHNIFGMPAGNNAVLTCSTIGGQGSATYACLDPATFQFFDNIMPFRTISQWPTSPLSSTANIGNPTLNAITCPGVTADNTCMGFTGFMNGVTFPLVDCTFNGLDPNNCPMMALPWSSNFDLSKLVMVPSSLFQTQGADLTVLQPAFTSSLYVCPVGVNCGPHGPYPDFGSAPVTQAPHIIRGTRTVKGSIIKH